MIQDKAIGFPVLPLTNLGAGFVAAIMMVVMAGTSTTATAQEKLTPVQQQTLVQCLVGCRKGDAACQNVCTNKVGTPAYFNAAGVCVRACSDALVGSGQQGKNLTEDLQKCVEACS